MAEEPLCEDALAGLMEAGSPCSLARGKGINRFEASCLLSELKTLLKVLRQFQLLHHGACHGGDKSHCGVLTSSTGVFGG